MKKHKMIGGRYCISLFECSLRFVPRRSRGGVPTASRRTPNTCLSVWSARCLLRRMFRLRAVGAQGPPLNAESFDWRVAAQRQGVCYLRFLESTFVLRVLIRRGALALIRGSDVLRGFVCAKQTQLDGLSSALLRAPRFFAAIPAGFALLARDDVSQGSLSYALPLGAVRCLGRCPLAPFVV